MIKVLCFAGIAEKVESDELLIDKEKMTVQELKQVLAEKYPVIQEDVARAMVAVNEEFTEESHVVTSADTVALIPPVSGG